MTSRVPATRIPALAVRGPRSAVRKVNPRSPVVCGLSAEPRPVSTHLAGDLISASPRVTRDMSLSAYLPIAVMTLLALGFAVASMGLSRLLAPHNPTPEKLDPYECGIVPLQEPVLRFPVKFYVVAMLFVLFDIEIIFLFAWAVRFTELGWYGVWAIGIFTLLLAETLVYAWKRGALDWNVAHRSRYRPAAVPVNTEEAA